MAGYPEADPQGKREVQDDDNEIRMAQERERWAVSGKRVGC
jgi:hypothetical protein